VAETLVVAGLRDTIGTQRHAGTGELGDGRELSGEISSLRTGQQLRAKIPNDRAKYRGDRYELFEDHAGSFTRCEHQHNGARRETGSTEQRAR
jgi:hypothetical protein